jgi:hypothetical protein
LGSRNRGWGILRVLGHDRVHCVHKNHDPEDAKDRSPGDCGTDQSTPDLRVMSGFRQAGPGWEDPESPKERLSVTMSCKPRSHDPTFGQAARGWQTPQMKFRVTSLRDLLPHILNLPRLANSSPPVTRGGRQSIRESPQQRPPSAWHRRFPFHANERSPHRPPDRACQQQASYGPFAALRAGSFR